MDRIKRYNWFREKNNSMTFSLRHLPSLIFATIILSSFFSILTTIPKHASSTQLPVKRKVYKSTYRSSKLQIPITHVSIQPGKAYNWSKTSRQHCLGYSKIYYFSSPKDTQISIKFNKFHMKYPHLDYMTAYMGGIPVLKNRTLVDFKPFYSRVKQFPILFSSKDHYRLDKKKVSKSSGESVFGRTPQSSKDFNVFKGQPPNAWSDDEHELISIGDEYVSDTNSLIIQLKL